MSEKDRELIKQGILADDWNQLEELIIQAESIEAIEILKARKKHLWFKELEFAGLL